MKKQTKWAVGVLMAVLVVGTTVFFAGKSELFQGRMQQFPEISRVSNKPNFKVDGVRLRGVDPLVFVSIANTGSCYEGGLKIKMTLIPTLGEDEVVYEKAEKVKLGCLDGTSSKLFTFVIDDDSFIASGGPEGGYEVLNLSVDHTGSVNESDEGDNELSIDLISNPGITTISN